eukprot:TRINITY_DN3311_c0_g2_i2.p1 TRINITY_DN3311_c0_g2~~TRINITY_DN3311_c0_g2_i2.p1  ORF type:complete len:455 (-),score=162.69 TRINITY_DN3311_c0_g2_i2:101-1465(-)
MVNNDELPTTLDDSKKVVKGKKSKLPLIILVIVVILVAAAAAFVILGSEDDDNDTSASSSRPVPTEPRNGEKDCYDATGVITCPTDKSADYYGQEAQYTSLPTNARDFTDNGDGTITDNYTGLMWVAGCDLNDDGLCTEADKLTFDGAAEHVKTFDLASYTDWRIPSVTELYTLMDFSGYDIAVDGTEAGSSFVPFIDEYYFGFEYGDTVAGERLIDVQFVSTNIYVADDTMMFGTNVADGRIKGYGLTMDYSGSTSGSGSGSELPPPGSTSGSGLPPPGSSSGSGELPPPGASGSGSQASNAKLFNIRYVRGNEWPVHQYVDNNDETITDGLTNLMWTKSDSGSAMKWKDALAYVQTKNDETYLGYNDWRLPSTRELQPLVDYSRNPDDGEASIDPIFLTTSIKNENDEDDYPWFFTSTTHASIGLDDEIGGGWASYVAFGRALGKIFKYFRV